MLYTLCNIYRGIIEDYYWILQKTFKYQQQSVSADYIRDFYKKAIRLFKQTLIKRLAYDSTHNKANNPPKNFKNEDLTIADAEVDTCDPQSWKSIQEVIKFFPSDRYTPLIFNHWVINYQCFRNWVRHFDVNNGWETIKNDHQKQYNFLIRYLYDYPVLHEQFKTIREQIKTNNIGVQLARVKIDKMQTVNFKQWLFEGDKEELSKCEQMQLEDTDILDWIVCACKYGNNNYIGFKIPVIDIENFPTTSKPWQLQIFLNEPDQGDQIGLPFYWNNTEEKVFDPFDASNADESKIDATEVKSDNIVYTSLTGTKSVYMYRYYKKRHY